MSIEKIKGKYVNKDLDGFKKENRSPLSPPWLLSGEQNEGKVLVGGKDGFVEWGEGGGGSPINTYTKTEIDAMFQSINQIVLHLRQNTYNKAEVDNKVSQDSLYLKMKDIIKQGEFIQLDKDDLTKTITISQTDKPIPPQPTTGIVCYNETNNEWITLNLNTVFNASDAIEGTGLNTGNTYTWERNQFNEKIIINANVDIGSANFLANCSNFNQELDFHLIGSTFIGSNFLYGCVKFNNKIQFNNLIVTIGEGFMNHCETFDQQILGLFTTNLKTIGNMFMNDCYEFTQRLDFTITGLNLIGGSFMYNCKNFDKGSLKINNTLLYEFDASDISYSSKNFATNDPSATVYSNGFNIIGVDKQTFNAAHNGAFKDSNSAPNYRKTNCSVN